MSQMLRAVYHQGAFVPEDPCDLAEGSKVVITVHQGAAVLPPEVTNPEERTRILNALVDRMKHNPLPPGAPRFTREEMHERGRH